MFLRRFGWYRKLDNFFQRGKKGYCNEDLWDLYHWFTSLFPMMLEDFMKKTNGYPCPFPPPSDTKDTDAWHKEQERKWKYEVNKLIWELREANDETCSQKNEIDYNVNFDFEEEKGKPWLKLNITYPTKEDEEKYKEHIKREKEIATYKEEAFKKALEQFEKIARNLWD